MRAKELGMEALAITDHGNMFGAIHFYKAAKKAGIKPILGCEVYVAAGGRFSKESRIEDGYYHLVLLAENNEGYQNLMKLVSYGYTEGFYYRPRIDLELLRKYNGGLIALSACLGGSVAQNILRGNNAEARKQAAIYKEIFGNERFYIEIQDHGMKEQKMVNLELLRIADEFGLQLVATNDIHYLDETDAKAHEVLLCIQTGKTMLDDDRMIYEGEQYFLKTAEQMAKVFANHPEAIENTMKIAKRCNVDIKFHEYKLPKYDCPDGLTAAEYLRKLVMEGLAQRFDEISNELMGRVDYELETINSMGFNDYFLVVWDFIKFARDNGISVGPGRGTSAASIVAYALLITNVDPIRYNLLFERFLNPERISMPDIDIDFCYERRQEVIDYVVDKYGADHVAQIITFGTLGAKAAVRDVGRGMGMPYAEVDAIAKMIPFALGITLDKALQREAGLRREYEENPRTKELIDMARRLEGLPRHSSTHAAGVVISDAPLTEYLPLQTNDGVVTTQFTMDTLEELGLLKMDFLGLRTLTVIKDTIDEVARRYDVKIDLDKIDTQDQKVFDAISAGKTEGMFQLESRGMTSFMKELKPTSIADLTAGISLFRPGPMEFIPKYVRSKNLGAAVSYTHPSLVSILQETYGVIVYQEQVMQIVRNLAGYSMGRADLIRRAMSKKNNEVMAKEKQFFIHGIEGEVAGCIANGIPQAVAEQIWYEMADFAKYAFNKAHAVAYATVGYQTAWLKMYYPAEYMAALLTSIMGQTSKVAEYLGECKKLGIEVLPPDINQSFGNFAVVGDNQIRFGLNAIKNLGRPTVATLVREREKGGDFRSLTDFLNRVVDGDMNKRSLESLIKAGALTSLGGKRSQYIAIYESLLTSVSNSKKQNMAGQMSLMDMAFGIENHGKEPKTELVSDPLTEMPEYTIEKMLADEKDVMGIYVSGHPINAYDSQMRNFVNAYSRDFMVEDNDGIEDAAIGVSPDDEGLKDGQMVVVGGIITKKNIVYTRKNNIPMCFLTIEDLYGYLEVVVFPAIYQEVATQLNNGQVVLIDGKVSAKEDQAGSVICEKIRFLQPDDNSQKTLWLKIPAESGLTPQDLLEGLSRYGGTTPVVIYDEATKSRLRLKLEHWINAESQALIATLQDILGDDAVVLK